MTPLNVDYAAPLLGRRASVENEDLVVTSGIDRLNDAKFQEFATFVKAFGVNADLAERIYLHYGTSAIQLIQTDPYRLSQ